jgi:hypothetical protein
VALETTINMKYVIRPYLTKVLATLAIVASFLDAGAYAGPARRLIHRNGLQEGKAARIAQLLEGSGYSYKKETEKVWSIDFTGKSLSSFKVVLVTQEELLVILTVVAKKTEFTVSPELLRKLLQFNNSIDRVKVGFDDEGDIFVRTDLSHRVIDDDEFKLNVKQVAAATDEVYAGIKPFLRTK